MEMRIQSIPFYRGIARTMVQKDECDEALCHTILGILILCKCKKTVKGMIFPFSDEKFGNVVLIFKSFRIVWLAKL